MWGTIPLGIIIWLKANAQLGNPTVQNNNKHNNQDFNEKYNILFDENKDIKSINNQNLLKPSDFNLDKKLAQSKRNITINEEKNFVSCRKWDYLDESKRMIFNNKIEKIYKEMDKYQLDTLKKVLKIVI